MEEMERKELAPQEAVSETAETQNPVSEEPSAAESAVPEAPVPEEPQETMADYEKELEASFRRIQEGDILTGTVIGVSET